MFCDNCGSSVREGSKFCLECGNRLPGADTAPDTPVGAPAAAVMPSSSQDSERKKGAGAFFTSPGGIILIVMLALLVVGGLVVGIIFAVRGGGNSKVDAATMDAWNEYETILKNDGNELAQIKIDASALNANQEALKKSQEQLAVLQKTLAKMGGTDEWRANPDMRPVNTRDLKAAQLAVALKAYNDYITKMNEFLTALSSAVAGNQLINVDTVNNLNAKLAEVQKAAADVKRLSGKFILGNDQLAAVDFDPDILKVSPIIASEVTKSVTAAQAAEQQRLTTEKAAADQAAAAAAVEAERQRQAAAAQKTLQSFTCPNCNGTGMTPGGTCGVCGGSGRVTRQILLDKGWFESDDGWMPPDTSY